MTTDKTKLNSETDVNADEKVESEPVEAGTIET